ncbi:hypothetical protein OIE71_04530 [Streptomyces sp. NBC_01725]|uniref:hypothetical protein n=1 Tax=Streptomyces sp. NBC_01725 TaxID=2975923 RepID=UPI002E2D768E|nr:hypothetical protein [Streptomyces sp. NBC_01725]
MIINIATAAAEKDTRSTLVPHTGESTRHAEPCEYPDVRPCLCPDRPPTFTDSAESRQRAHRRGRINAYFVAARWTRTVLAAGREAATRD